MEINYASRSVYGCNLEMLIVLQNIPYMTAALVAHPQNLLAWRLSHVDAF